jgi:uncharacterized protein (TIGR02996 family)
MSNAALRQAWAEWRAFADGLDLSDGSPDCAVLHARLFRLCGNVPLRVPVLRSALAASAEALTAWIAPAEGSPADLEQLRRAMTACEPGWRALLGMTARRTDWAEVSRAALAAGLAWPDEPFWSWQLQPANYRRFDLLSVLRGRDHASSMALLDALLRVLDHPHGEQLFRWARETTTLLRPQEALHAAALFRDAAAQGALRQELLAPLGWQELPGRLVGLCQNVTLCFLSRLNEPVPGIVARKARKAPGRAAPYRRAVPEPLPIEPSLRKVEGCEGFLRAIAEEPLEQAHRLAFADWLEENGHADRASFVRLQCAADRLPDHPLARRHLTEPIEALFKKHRAKWVGGMPRSDYLEPIDVSNFRGGLLEALAFKWQTRPEEYARLFSAADIRALRTTVYGDRDTGTGFFLQLPFVPRLVSLALDDLYDQDYPNLAGAEALAGLVHLRIGGSWFNAEAARAFVKAFRLPALRELDLPRNNFGEAGMQAVVDGGVLANIRKLGLVECQSFGKGALRTFASSPTLARLEHLDLSGSRVGSAGAEALAACPFLTSLTTLVLDRNYIGDAGAAALGSPLLKRLECLSLRRSNLLDRGLEALAGAANLAGLRVLDLGENDRVGEGGIRALAESPHLTNLRALSLSGIALTANGAQALAGSPNLANLEVLDLSGGGLDAAGARALSASPHLSKLSVLDLRGEAFSQAARTAIRRRWPFALL